MGMFILAGCGADSDLLRDENIARQPTGGAYDILKEVIYAYNFVGDRVGFNYLALNDECTTKECFLLQESYELKNNESQVVPTIGRIILSKNGFFDKSRHRECSIKYSGNTFTERCPDGRTITTNIVTTDLEGKGLREGANAIVYANKLKDSRATFTYKSAQYDFKDVSDERLYEMVNQDVSKCKTIPDNVFVQLDDTLAFHPNIRCEVNGLSIDIHDLQSNAGTFSVNGAIGGAWEKALVYDRYTVVTLDAINGQQYFIASYNDFVRIGEVIPKEHTRTYLNTEAFNVIYTQLKDVYKK